MLGNEVVRRLVGSGRFAHTDGLALEAMITGLKAVGIARVGAGPVDDWAARPTAAHTAVVMFKPPWLYHGRERSLWTPQPAQLPALGFERLLLVRSARKPEASPGNNVFEKTAAWLLSTLAYMIPASAQPVRPAKLAHFVDAALRLLPPGTHVASPELLHQANQTVAQSTAADANSMDALVRDWLEAGHNRSLGPETPPD